MGMKADGVLYLAAEFIDTFKEINKQVNKGAVEVAKNNQIKLSVDEKSISESIEGMLKSKRLEGFDLSDMIIPALQKASNQNLSKEDRVRTLKELEDNLLTLRRAPLKVLKGLKGANSKDITTAVQNINQDMLDNPAKWATVSPSKEIGRMLSEQLSSTVNDIQNQLIEEFGKDTAKYGVSEKEANNRLNNIYDSLVEKAKEQSKIEGNNVGLDEIVTDNELKSIQGFYSRIESLGGIASDKAKKLADMLTSMSNDGAIEEGLDDIIYQISEDVNSFTEREKQLIQETKQQQKEIDELNAQNKSSSRQKIKPNFNVENQEQDTTSTIFQSAEKENKIQETKTQQQENKKIIERTNEITATESKSVDVKKQQTQEIEKQNDLLKKQKQIKDETTPIKSEIDISSQDQVQQEIQETASTAQSAVKSNEQLAESVQEVTQAVQQEGQAMSNSSIDDYLVKWIEMVRGTKAYSGMEERAVYLKGGIPTSDIGQGKLSYKNGFVQGQTSIKQYKGGEADTLLHSHQYSKDVDNLRFSFSDIKQGMSDLAEGVQNGIHKLILSCGDEILSLDFGNVSKETASEVQENIRQIYTAAWTIFGGQVFSDGTASERGMTDELRNKASAFINTMLRKMLEEMGGSLTSAKLVDGKMIDTTAFRLNQAITPQQQSLYEQIKKIYGLSENEYEGYRGDILKKLQKDNGIKTNLTGLVGLSPEQLEEVDKLLLQIFNHKQQLENAKAGSRMAATIQEKIDEAEKRIAEITKVSNKDIQQQADKKLDEEKVDVVSEKETDNSQQELKIVEKIEEVENNIANEKEKQAEQTQKQNDVLQQQKENESNIKEQNEDVVNKKEEAIEKTREELQTEQQLTNELKEQKSIEQTSGETSKEDKKEAELQTIKEIKEEAQQVAEQQQKITEARQETAKVAQEELKTEQQLSAEVQNQEKAEEKKTKVTLVHNGKKLPDVQRHGKTQTEINAQIKAEEEKKKKKSSTPKSDLEEKKRVEEIAAADAKEEEIETINNLNFMAALRAKLAEAEAQQVEKEAQKIEVTSEQMQKLKQGIQEATEALKEYKEIDEQIIKLQSDKDAYIISPSTQNEMMQAGVLSSSIDMAEYIRSAYRTYKKTGNEADEKVLKEALRQYMLPTGKKNGEYTYRDDKYLYSKNGKELKSYTKDKDFKGYVKQAQDEEAAYEKAQRKLPTLLDQKKSGQQSFVETSAKIQQLLQEAGLDADKVNEILAAINGNLTNEEAIWKVINSYIKEVTEELEKQDNITEKKESSISENANKEAVSNENIEQTNIVEQQEKNQQAVEKTIELTEKAQEQIQELTDSKIPESTVVSEIGKEAENTKEKLEKVADSVEEVKNKATSKSVNKGATKEDSEFSYKEFARGHISETNSPFINAKKWIESGLKTDNIKQLETYYEKYNNIKNRLKATKDKPENKANFKLLIDEYDSVRKSVTSVLDVIEKLNSEENKMLASQKAQADIVKGTINNRASLARSTQKRLDSDYYDKQVSKTENVLSQYTSAESPEAAKAIEQANNALEKYKNTIIELKQFNSGELQLDRPFEELIEEVNKADVEVKELTKNIQDNFSKVASSNSITDLQSQIKSILSTYNRISPEGKQKLEDIFGSLKIGETTTKQLANFRTQLRATIAEERELGNLSSTIFDRMVGKMQEGIAFLATKVSFYEIFNQFRNGFGIIHEFDDALTEMMKVSDETRTSLQRYQKTTFETADAIGTSALQIQNSTADFMRLGETLDQAAESAKSANVLMNVSEFQSIDEATKSLIAMGAAYNDLSKMNIIDKLNEVGNNYAISTSEAATALQSSASALKTAGNDMDEALALITAGNAVVQDANKVGTGMRTIALRLTGTKSAKEELEEMGEETENVITTQSKLRDTIKEATAVASNGFKGFDILDDNGNYKSTYEIMLGIADVYNEILETDKKFGRNNANLLLESVAGKNRANIAASIFQNPQLLRDAYQSSQEANGSAMRENDKYVQSISGHLAQLTNAWQQMWANAANRDVINFFIDAAKAVVNFANAVGVLPATLGLMLPYLEIITRAKSGKGIVSSFLEWANGLNEAKKVVKEMAEAQEGLNVIEETATAINTAKTVSEKAKTAATIEATGAELAESAADATGVASSTAKTASNEAETLSAEEQAWAYVQLGMAEEAEQVAESGGIFAKASGGIDLLKGAFTGLVSTIGAVPLAIGAAAVVLFAAKKAYDAHRESVFADAKATAENIKTQQEATSQQIESYKQLKAQLDSGDLSEQETINVKQQILDIQKSITEQYGTAAQGVDLINGKLEEQVGLLDSISQKEAQDQYFKDYEGFQVAEQEYNKNNRSYNIGLNNTGNANLDKAITDELLKNGFRIQAAGMGTFNASVKGTASDGINALENTKKALEELKAEYRDRDTLEALNKQIAKIEEQISKAYEVVDKYEATALKGLELDLAGNDTKGYDIYKNYQSSVSNLEDAYITGDTQKINEARKAFDEATKAKNDFLKVGDNEQFALLFDKIDTSLVDAKNKFRDTVELFKDIPVPEEKEGLFGGTDKKTLKDNAKAQSKLTKEQKKAYKAAEKLYKLNPDKVDIQATLKDNTYASGKYADALKALMDAMGWTTADADSLINALVTAGIVHGDAADVAYMASDSYNAFSSSVESAIGVLNTLNTALTESAKGTGLTEQTLTELKAAFGDNLDSVLERTANGYHLNTQGAYLLRQEQEAMVKADYASSMYEQYQALDKLQEGYLKAKAAGEDTSGFIQQREAIQNNIDKLNEDLMAFNNANSAYQTWLSKQNSEGEREMYNSVYSGYDAVKDELERGWAGEKTRSWLDLIFNDENEDWDAWTSSAEKIKEKFDEVTKDIKGTGGYSIADFFTVDANGKTTSEGVWNFFDAIQNKQKEIGKEFVNLEEGWFDFTENGDYQIADMLGMDIESVHSILRAAADAGFEIHLDQPLFSLEQLEEKAISAKKALEETTGTELKININPKSEREVDDAMQKLTSYQQSLAEDTSLDPKVKTERLQQVADLLNFMAAKKREFVEGKLFDFKVFDSKELETSKKNINDIVNKLSSYSKEAGKTDFSEQFAIDPMLLNNVDYLQEKINTLKEIRPNVDDTQVQYLDQLLAQLQYRVNLLNETDISGDSITVDQFMAAEKVVDDINSKLDYAAQHQDIHFNWDADETFIENLNLLANLPEEVKSKLGITPDATGEELLELAKSGELHLEVKTTGNTPQPKDTQTTNTQTNNVINKTTTISEEQVNQVVTTSMDTSLFDKGAEHVTKTKEELGKGKSEPKVGMDKKDFDKGASNTESKVKTLDGLNATPYVSLGGASQVASAAESIKSQIASIKGKTVSVVANFSSSGLGALKSGIQSAINKANELASNYTAHFANGTAHAYGTAFARGSVVSNHAYAGGKWGLPEDQTALTGELGTEIVVRDGNWFTVGDDGAEFVNLRKGDIVFNHKQSRELLENGYVTSNKGRGHLVGFANGTAYSHGSTSGALRPSKKSTGMGGSSRGSGGGSRSSGGSGGSGGGNSSSKDAKETKNTLDEVEILIGRIEARISDLDKIIGSTYNTWEDRNDSIIDNLRLVTQEISDQRNAYTTYMNKANSINLSESWKQKIRDGAFRIEDVTDSDLWDKIQEYQTWYNKAVASEQALIDLTNKRGELYQQLFENTQTYYDNMVEAIQHEIDVQDTFIDRLEEAGKLSSKILIYRQYDQEQKKLVKLNEELQMLKTREKQALNSGYIEYGSEAWSEMESAIADVCAAIAEAENNLISYDKALNEVDWTRWDRIHDSIDGVVNELEFLYDLMNEDDLFTEQGDITAQGTTALALLAHEYDVYFAEVQQYQKEIDDVQKDLAKDPYNQILVDKLKELKEAQQDAASGAKKMKDSIVDVTEKGIKKQIDYVKKLIEDYEELLETQKDQIDYAKKVADQQKELNKLEKQYRAIQNDDSEETATKRQQLKNQIEEARQSLKETQDDRRLSETKDMLSKFEESFEEFLENKLKDIEGIVREAIDTANTSRGIIKDTINDLASSYGYTPSDTLKSTLDDMSRSFVSYFNGQFENDNVASIADNVSKIVDYYQRVQNQTNQEAAQDTMTEAVRHDGNIQTYRDENGNLISGYFRSDGTRDETYTGWAEKEGRKYRFENGQQLTGAQFIDVDGKRYHLDSNGAVQTGWQKINDQWYYMNGRGEMQTGWQNLNGKWYYMNSQGQMQTGAQSINGKTYVMDESGAMLSGGWQKSGGKWYYLNSDGSAKTGWLKDNNKWYYLNSQGVMQTGAQSIGGKTYVMDSSGAMLSNGWKYSNGKWYYLNSDGTAKMGWFKDNNKWYYLSKWDNGAMVTGAQKLDGKQYLFDNSGAMLSSGWKQYNGKWYYLDSNGAAQTGWQKIDGKWYLLNKEGIMQTGFYSESGKTYYMNGSGAMQTGWQKINGQWYYFDSNGAAASGWAELKWGSDTNWYYFDPKTKAMLTNTWIDKGGITTNPQKGAYYVTSDGTMVKNGRRSTNKGWLTFEKDGKWTGYKTGTSGVKTNGLYWTNEGNKAEAIIRKSDGAILTPLSKGDSVIPNSAMKNMYQALTDPAKYLKQYTTPDVRVIQSNNSTNGQPPVVNMQFIANGVQDANRFVNDLMNNKKLEKWVQEVTLGQANGNNNYKKYSYVIR